MEIREKDRLFLLVVIPLTAIAVYCWQYRIDAAARIAAAERRLGALVETEDFPLERATAERRLAEAKAELERERTTPVPSVLVKGDRNESAAVRELAAMAVFREAGLVIRRVEDGEAYRGEDSSSAAAALLKATGVRPSPVARRYGLEGAYPAFRAALAAFAERESAVIVTAVGMSGEGRWTVEAVL